MGRRHRSESSSPSRSSQNGGKHYHSPSPRKERSQKGYRSPSSSPPRRNKSYEPEYRRRGRNTENPPPSKCVGVFGLSIYTEESTVRDIFSKFGPIKRIAMIYCPQVIELF